MVIPALSDPMFCFVWRRLCAALLRCCRISSSSVSSRNLWPLRPEGRSLGHVVFVYKHVYRIPSCIFWWRILTAKLYLSLDVVGQCTVAVVVTVGDWAPFWGRCELAVWANRRRTAHRTRSRLYTVAVLRRGRTMDGPLVRRRSTGRGAPRGMNA